MTALLGADLRLSYGDRIVAEGLDIEVPAGQVTALVGPNAEIFGVDPAK